MAKILCSSPKKEAELPTKWYKEIWEAQYIFDLEIKSHCDRENTEKIKWIMEPEIIKNKEWPYGYNIIGIAKTKKTFRGYDSIKFS